MSERTDSKSEHKHYVIGIGASAGGLEALQELFDYMPPDTGYSFVVIQHLSPDHKSLLSELLAKNTSIALLGSRLRNFSSRLSLPSLMVSSFLLGIM